MDSSFLFDDSWIKEMLYYQGVAVGSVVVASLYILLKFIFSASLSTRIERSQRSEYILVEYKTISNLYVELT